MRDSVARNKELAKKFRGQKCVVCGTRFGTVGDHIITFGSGRSRSDVEENIWPLCIKHHHEKGLGLISFVKKYRLEEELITRGFYICPVTSKWRRINE